MDDIYINGYSEFDYLYEEDEPVNTPPDLQKIFKTETKNMKVANVVIREVKILDQYGPEYDDIIEKNKTPKSICGYIVCAVAPLLSELTSYMMTRDDINGLIEIFNDPNVMVPKVEEIMEMI